MNETTCMGRHSLVVMGSKFTGISGDFSETREELKTRWGNYPRASLAHRLFEVLEMFLDGRVPVLGHGSKLNRTVISKEIGVTNAALSRFVLMFSDFENFLGLESTIDAKIPAMEKWLAENFEKGTLDTTYGRMVNRTQFLNAFGIWSITVDQNPRIAKLLARFDEKVAEGSYIPGYKRTLLAKLIARCSDGEFIGPNGHTFKWEKAAELVGVTASVLRNDPYRAVIDNIVKEHRKSILNNPLVAIVGRDFSFEYLIEFGWNIETSKRIVDRFQTSFQQSSSGWLYLVYRAIKDFLNWFSTHNADHVRHCAELAKIGKIRSIRSDFWNICHSDYGHAIRVRYPNANTRNTRYKAANAALSVLVEGGIVPEISIPFRNDRVTDRKYLPTFYEAVPKSAGPACNSSNADRYLAFVKQKFVEAAANGIEIDAADSSLFLETLRNEIGSETFEPNRNPDDVIASLMQRRLDLIQGECTRRLDQSRKRYDHGQLLMKKGVSPNEYWDKLFGSDVKRPSTSTTLRQYFPDLIENDQGVANLLVFVAERFESIYPAAGKTKLLEGAFFQNRAREYGGSLFLQSCLVPDMDAVGSTLTLYLCASGSNVSVGRTLLVDSIQPSQASGHSTVTGFKARAQGKPIFVELPTSSAAVKGIQWLKETLQPMRRLLPSDDRNLLFIVRLQGAIKHLKENVYRDFFKGVLSAIPELAQLNLTPNMIRPTVLLLSTIKGDGSTRTSLALGQHSVQVHQGYTNKFPVMFQRDKDIRDFVDLFETLTIEGNEKIFGLIGLKDHEFDKRLRRATQTGFGILCGDRHGKPGSNGAICKELDCWNGCPQIMVLARKEDIALLILWQRSLHSIEGEWIRDRPERWLQVWLPWLTFVKIVEEKLRGKYEQVWRDAVALADKISAHPSYRPYRIS